MSFLQKLKRKAIDNGKLFPIKKSKLSATIPRPQCGYTMSFIPMQNLLCQTEVDIESVVSLALLNCRSPTLKAYGNKLFIMTLNVSRFLYTLEAFTFRNKNVSTLQADQQALEFYVQTDLKYRCKELPPNQQFSQFLHRLKSCGYLEYVFDLAKELNLNIDYIVDSRIAARYIKCDRIDNQQYRTAIGVLTVIHELNNEWYVKTTNDSILN